MKKIYKILFVLLWFILAVWLVYASVTTAKDRKSPSLAWQWTHPLSYDSAHNVWDTYESQDRFTADTHTVTDSLTWLMWQRDWSTSWSMYWDSAKSYCANLSLWWYNDWRLPEIKELQSIIDYSTSSPWIDTSKFHSTLDKKYRSSTTFAYDTDNVWVMYFIIGSTLYDSKNNWYYVRCVR